MRRILLSIAIVFTIALSLKVNAQTVAGYYVWEQSNGTYTPLVADNNTTPANIYPLRWDDIANVLAFKLPFAFNYKGTNYPANTIIGLDTDAWFAFNPGTMTGQMSGGSWISASNSTGVFLYGTANNNSFAGFNADLHHQAFTSFTGNIKTGTNTIFNVSSTANLRIGTRLDDVDEVTSGIPDGTVVTAIAGTTVTMSANATATVTAQNITPYASIYGKTIGTAPNRQFVIQWTDVKRYAGTGINEKYNFQMILNEAGGVANQQTLQVIFGPMSTDAPASNKLLLQIGLRGASSADFNARQSDPTDTWNTSLAAGANTDHISIYKDHVPASGLTWTWKPCTGAPNAAGATISGLSNPCPGSTQTYTVSSIPNAVTYTWTYTNANGTIGSATTNNPSNTISFNSTSGGSTGTLTVTPKNDCGTGTPISINISVTNINTSTISYATSGTCATSGTATPTITGTTGGVFSSSGGLSINSSSGVIDFATSVPGTYSVGYNYSSNGCNVTATTLFTIKSRPTVTINSTLPIPVCGATNSGTLQAVVAEASAAYSVSSIAHSPSTQTAPINIIYDTYQDDAMATVTMPFSFGFYGTNYTSVNVSTNGFISFGAANNAFSSTSIPNTSTPNNFIALCWRDLQVDPSVNPGARIISFTTGTAPNRVFVVEYYNLTFFSGSGANVVSGQIKLYEGTNMIDVVVTNVDDGGTGLKTLGIENATGTLGITPANRNYTNWTAAAEAWRFMPVGSFTYAWSPATFLNNTTIANPTITNINATTNYSVTVTDGTTGCSSVQSFTVPVVSSVAITSTTNNFICGQSSGTATISATGTGSQINWYSAATGGTLLGTGNSYTTPTISATTTYYAEAQSNTCKSARVPVTVTFKNKFSNLAITPNSISICNPTSPFTALSASGANIFVNQFSEFWESSLPSGWSTSSNKITPTINTTLFSQGSSSLRLKYAGGADDSYISPVINLSGSIGATLTFDHICALQGPGNWVDLGFLEYYNGTAWVLFNATDYQTPAPAIFSPTGGFGIKSYSDWSTLTQNSTPTNTMWKSEVYNIPSLVSNFQIRFRITSNNNKEFYGWLIDNLKITKTVPGGATLTWSPTTGLFTNNGATTAYTGTNLATVYPNPTATTTYTVTASNSAYCDETRSITVYVRNTKLNPIGIFERCDPGVFNLSVSPQSPNAQVKWYSAATGGTQLATGNSYTTPSISTPTTYYVEVSDGNPASATLGAGSLNNSSDYVNPFYYLWGANKRQYLVLGSELASLGFTAGNISSLGMNFTTAGPTYNGFTISMGATTATNLNTTSWENVTTTVLNSINTAPTVGLNTYTFSTPFNWDGVSNVVIQMCWGNNNTGNSSASPTVLYDNVPFYAVNYQRADNQNSAGICGYTTIYNRASQRPQFVFGGGSTCVGSPRTAVLADIKPGYTWKGINTNWNDPINWCSGVPTSTSDVIIPNGVAFYPIITNAQTPTPVCRKIDIQSNASVTINNGGTMKVYGNLANLGTFQNDGTLELSGSAAQTFPGNGTVPNMNNVTINNTLGNVTLTKSIGIKGELKSQSGILDLSSYDITLLSNSLSTARVSETTVSNPFNYSSTGRFNVERYIGIAGGRKWQFIAWPIQSDPGSTFYTNWQLNGSTPGLSPAGKGLFVSQSNYIYGAGASLFSNFDAKGPGGTIKSYNPTTDIWDEAINSTITNYPSREKSGYMVYVRGDRNCLPSNSSFVPTTLTVRGKLWTNTLTSYQTIPANKSNSVSNPYASALDVSKVLSNTENTSLKKGFTLWDPTLPGVWNLGAYNTMSFAINPPQPSINSGLYSAGTSLVRSGQAFFVENGTSSAVNLSFNESNKDNTIGTNNTVVMRHGNLNEQNANPEERPFLHTQLNSPTGNAADGNLVVFDNSFSTTEDEYDLKKITNSGENFGLKSFGEVLAVESRKILTENDTIFYDAGRLAVNVNYKLRFAPTRMSGFGLQGEFIDQFLNTRTPVSLSDTTYIDVLNNGTPGSSAADRFYLVFKSTGTLPVRFVSISANKNVDGRTNHIRWKVSNEEGVLNYELQRSNNGIDFTPLTQNIAVNNLHIYDKDDIQPLTNDNFYRAKAYDQNGSVFYSSIVKVGSDKAFGMISIYPNPIEGDEINVKFDGVKSGKYKIELTNKLGQLIANSEFGINGNQIKTLKLAKKLASGTYQLTVFNDNGKIVFVENVVK